MSVLKAWQKLLRFELDPGEDGDSFLPVTHWSPSVLKDKPPDHFLFPLPYN